MKIQIQERLRPFSHTPGARCAIPGTHAICTAFPTLLQIDAFSIPLPFTGPVSGFTLQQDLEKNCVWVLGKAPEGRFKIRIEAKIGGFSLDFGGRENFFPHSLAYLPPAPFERLSLGSHKAQNWDLMLSRFSLEEILPLLFVLGQKTPVAAPPSTGTARLLGFGDLPSLEAFVRAAFSPMLVPRLTDDQHQGLCPEEKAPGNPFSLLYEAARRIRSLFVVQDHRTLSLLPVSLFDAGRMTDVQLPGIGSLDFEWLKKRLSRVVLRATHTTEITFCLAPSLKTFRAQTRTRPKPSKQSCNQPFTLESGTTYFLDRFYI